MKGAVEGLLSEVIHEVNGRERGRIVIAVDIPSGLPADMDGAASENRAETKDSGRRYSHRQLHSYIHSAQGRNVSRQRHRDTSVNYLFARLARPRNWSKKSERGLCVGSRPASFLNLRCLASLTGTRATTATR